MTRKRGSLILKNLSKNVNFDIIGTPALPAATSFCLNNDTDAAATCTINFYKTDNTLLQILLNNTTIFTISSSGSFSQSITFPKGQSTVKIIGGIFYFASNIISNNDDINNWDVTSFTFGSNYSNIIGASALSYIGANTSLLDTLVIPDIVDTIEQYGTTGIGFKDVYFPKSLKILNMSVLATPSTNTNRMISHIFPGITTAYYPYRNSAIFAMPVTITSYWHYTDNDPILFDLSTLVSIGSTDPESKGTYSYTIYTDNTAIKNTFVESANSGTIVNVYHLDGSNW